MHDAKRWKGKKTKTEIIHCSQTRSLALLVMDHDLGRWLCWRWREMEGIACDSAVLRKFHRYRLQVDQIQDWSFWRKHRSTASSCMVCHPQRCRSTCEYISETFSLDGKYSVHSRLLSLLKSSMTSKSSPSKLLEPFHHSSDRCVFSSLFHGSEGQLSSFVHWCTFCPLLTPAFHHNYCLTWLKRFCTETLQ